MMIGHPQRSIHTYSLSDDKFVLAVVWHMVQLGLEIDTRSMCTIYLLTKYNDILACIEKGWTVTSSHTRR